MRALLWKPVVLAAFLLPACLCAGSVKAEPLALPEPALEIIRQKRCAVPPSEDREAQLLPWANKLEGCTVTYYDICEACCGKTDGITYSGTPAVPYETCAVDPEVIPLGAWVAVDYGGGELHYYHAEDAGAGVKGNHIDICVASHEEAWELGVKGGGGLLGSVKLSSKTRKLCRQQDKLLELWKNNWNDCRIADALDVTPSAVWQWRWKNGLPRNCERGRQW